MKKNKIIKLTSLFASICLLASCSPNTSLSDSNISSSNSSENNSSNVNVDYSREGLLNTFIDYYESGDFSVSYDITTTQDSSIVSKVVTDAFTQRYVWIEGEQAGYVLADSPNPSWSDNGQVAFQFTKEGDNYEIASPLLSYDSSSNIYSHVSDLSSLSGFQYIFDDNGELTIDKSYILKTKVENVYKSANPSILSCFKKFAQASSESTIDLVELSLNEKGEIVFTLYAGNNKFSEGKIFNLGNGGNKELEDWVTNFNLPSEAITSEKLSNIVNVDDYSQSSMLAKTTVTLKYLGDNSALPDEDLGNTYLSFSPNVRVSSYNLNNTTHYQQVFVNQNNDTTQLQRNIKDGSVSYESLSTSWDKGFINSLNPFLMLSNDKNEILTNDGENYYVFSKDMDSLVHSISLITANQIPTFSRVKFKVQDNKVVSMQAEGVAGYNQNMQLCRYVINTEFSTNPETTPIGDWSYYKDKDDSRLQTFSIDSFSEQEKKDNEQINKTFSYLKGETAKSFSVVAFKVSDDSLKDVDNIDSYIPFTTVKQDLSSYKPNEGPSRFNAFQYNKDKKTVLNSFISSHFINGKYVDYDYQMTRGFTEVNGKVYPVRINDNTKVTDTSKVSKVDLHIYSDALKATNGKQPTIYDKIALDSYDVFDSSSLCFKIDENGDYILRDPNNTVNFPQYFFMVELGDTPENLKIVLNKNDSEHKIHYITYENTDTDGNVFDNYIVFNYDVDNNFDNFFPFTYDALDQNATFVKPTSWKEENSYIYSLMVDFLGEDLASKIPFDYDYLKSFSGNFKRDAYDVMNNQVDKLLSITPFDGDTLSDATKAKNYLDSIKTTMTSLGFSVVSNKKGTGVVATKDKIEITFNDLTSESVSAIIIKKL